MGFRLIKLVCGALLLVPLVLTAVAGAYEGPRGDEGSDRRLMLGADEQPCSGVWALKVEVDPKQARVAAGRGVRFTLQVRDDNCPQAVHDNVEVCVRGNNRVDRDLRLAQRCVSPPPFSASSEQIPLRVQSTKQARGMYAIKFKVSEVFEVPELATSVEYTVATRATLKIISGK